MTLTIFDLDGTVVDSSHRYLADANGTVNLSHWRANSTPQNIQRDSELPLANHWRALHRNGSPIVVCTARVMKSADFQWLLSRKLYADVMLCRNGESDTRSGVEQKLQQLKRFSPLKQSVTFWEDNPEISEAIRKAYKFTVKHPEEYKA